METGHSVNPSEGNLAPEYRIIYVVRRTLLSATDERILIITRRPASPTTGEVYRAFMNGKRLPIAIEEARQGARILWIAEPTVLTSKTLVFFHGTRMAYV